MRLFKVVGKFVTVHAGLVRLDADQARRRKHALREVSVDSDDDRGTFEIKGTIGFKAGEIFWFDGSISKAFVEEIDIVAESGEVVPVVSEDDKTTPEVLETSETGLRSNQSHPGYGTGSGPDAAEWQKYDVDNAKPVKQSKKSKKNKNKNKK